MNGRAGAADVWVGGRRDAVGPAGSDEEPAGMRGGSDVIAVPVVGPPHSPQNFCDAGLSAPQVGQRAARFAGPPLARSSESESPRMSSALNASASW
jgi:hypothetical protein